MQNYSRIVLLGLAHSLFLGSGGSELSLCRRIDGEQICSRINQQLIAGRSGHKDLCQLRTKLKDTQCETYLYAEVYA